MTTTGKTKKLTVSLSDEKLYRAIKHAAIERDRALRLHPLKGNRAGQYSMSVTENYRLIVERVEEDTVRIVDVEDYHDD
ncbi:MAG: type II toxin-antitoxin system RelE/ParE family toxin [Chloroflexi bacterium]|nr:type II toxin-antitoxin system RelE/ParE family toxin [Chloroflexota bacterium]